LVNVERKELLESRAELEGDVAVLPNELEEGWMEQVTPDAVILFVGRKPDDRPTEETLKVLEGVMVLRTDERGTITYFLDGDNAVVRAER
jgi:beta-lactamase superfamily II metal-dependent hydrolase